LLIDTELVAHVETLIAYKALVKPKLEGVNDASQDPQEITIEFILGTNDEGQVIDITPSEIVPPSNGEQG
jgi:hypothetical protein